MKFAALILVSLFSALGFADTVVDSHGKGQHPSAFYQPREGETALDFGFSTRNTRVKMEDATATNSMWSTRTRAIVEWGLSDHFSAGLGLGYIEGKSAAFTHQKGVEDVEGFAKFAFPGESMNLYLGGRFLYSAQDSTVKPKGSSFEQNGFSGGHSVGINGGFAAHAPYGQAGVKVDYLHRQGRLQTKENLPDTTYTGGNVMTGRAFYEYDLDGMPLGFNLNMENTSAIDTEISGTTTPGDAVSLYGVGLNTRLYWNADMSLVPELNWWTTGDSSYKVYDRWDMSVFFRWSL
ncbi:MAG: hypothetical protein AB7O96_12470 [Pseudobdellovibrionaceae bacterium]